MGKYTTLPVFLFVIPGLINNRLGTLVDLAGGVDVAGVH